MLLAYPVLFLEWFLQLWSNPHSSRRLCEDLLYHNIGNLLLQSHTIWSKERRATYQRAMAMLFHDMMHKEVYINDMIAKSMTEEGHLVDLQKIFERLRKYDLKLNPNKCVFVVASGKLLGFISVKAKLELILQKLRPSKKCYRGKQRKKLEVFWVVSITSIASSPSWQSLVSLYQVV